MLKALAEYSLNWANKKNRPRSKVNADQACACFRYPSIRYAVPKFKVAELKTNVTRLKKGREKGRIRNSDKGERLAPIKKEGEILQCLKDQNNEKKSIASEIINKATAKVRHLATEAVKFPVFSASILRSLNQKKIVRNSKKITKNRRGLAPKWKETTNWIKPPQRQKAETIGQGLHGM